MILTVTLNPALDVTYHVDRLRLGETHRVTTVTARAGGKGVNVARVLHALGEPVLACGLAGGSTGQHIDALLRAAGVGVRFTAIEADSRRTVVIAGPGQTTGLWEPGPGITGTEWSRFLADYRSHVTSAHTVVLSGSLPPGVPDNAYAELIAAARSVGVGTVLDADGDALRHGVAAGPDLVKPNVSELAAAVGGVVDDAEQALHAAHALRAAGPAVVVASLGALGMVVATAGRSYRAYSPERVSGNPTGAGDAAVAALARGLIRDDGWPTLLADAVALSAAAVRAPAAGEFCAAIVDRIRAGVVVTTSRVGTGHAADRQQ